MLKLAAIGVSILVALPVNQEGAMPSVYTITITPNPLTQGGRCLITYDGPRGTVLTLDWDPEGSPTSVTVGSDGKARVEVPANAVALVVTDGEGNNDSAIVAP